MNYVILTEHPEFKNPIGLIREKEFGNEFYYSLNDPEDSWLPVEDYPHRIWIGTNGACGWRMANIKKTVAYIVIDEWENGQPLIEKWSLTKNEII
tara:strand:+ start:1613 stop:1897 length:285 start_codon:yes stop_codon:yes gene_type:complete